MKLYAPIPSIEKKKKEKKKKREREQRRVGYGPVVFALTLVFS